MTKYEELILEKLKDQAAEILHGVLGTNTKGVVSIETVLKLTHAALTKGFEFGLVAKEVQIKEEGKL